MLSNEGVKKYSHKRAELQPKQFLYLRIIFSVSLHLQVFVVYFSFLVFFLLLLLQFNLFHNGTNTKPWLEISP